MMLLGNEAYIDSYWMSRNTNQQFCQSKHIPFSSKHKRLTEMSNPALSKLFFCSPSQARGPVKSLEAGMAYIITCNDHQHRLCRWLYFHVLELHHRGFCDLFDYLYFKSSCWQNQALFITFGFELIPRLLSWFYLLGHTNTKALNLFASFHMSKSSCAGLH